MRSSVPFPARLAALFVLPLVACGASPDTPIEVPIARPAPTLAKPPVRTRDGEEGVFDPGSRAPARVEEPRPAVVVCPNGARWDGSACIVAEVECPSHSKLVGSRCIGEVRCPDDSAWDGSGCRPFAKLPPPFPRPTAPSTAPTASEGRCEVNINSIPTTDVFVDGAAFGPTPRMRAPVAAGPHTVLFVSSSHGKKSVSFTCRDGETKSVVVKMTD